MVAWVSCPDNPEFEDSMNDYLRNNVKINDIAYAIAFNLTAFGDAYLNTFYSDDRFRKIQRVGDYFELEDVKEYSHLYRYGIPSGYLRRTKNASGGNGRDYDVILSEKDIIHFTLFNQLTKDSIIGNTTDEYGDKDVVEFTVRRGLSPVLEGARKSYRTKELLDAYLMMVRMSHSQFYRLIGVEVGGLDSVQATRLIKDLKTKITNSQSIDLTNRRMNTYAAPINSGAPIFYPVKSGLGALHIDSVEGKEASALREMLDIERFDNQFFASLKTPKQLLGQDMEHPVVGDGPFTIMDVRYGRTVKLIQNALINGLRSLVEWKISLDGIRRPQFDVIMPKISTAEDEARDKAFQNELDRFNTAIDMVEKFSGEMSAEKKKKVLDYVLSNIFKSDALSTLFANDDEEPVENEENNEEDNDSGFGDGGTGSDPFGDSDDSFDDIGSDDSSPFSESGPSPDMSENDSGSFETIDEGGFGESFGNDVPSSESTSFDDSGLGDIDGSLGA